MPFDGRKTLGRPPRSGDGRGVRGGRGRRSVRRSRSRVARGGRVLMIWTSEAVNTPSKAAVNVRSRSRNRKRRWALSRSMCRLRACWVSQARSAAGSGPGYISTVASTATMSSMRCPTPSPATAGNHPWPADL